MAERVVAFKMERRFATLALKGPEMRSMIAKKGKLAQSLYFNRVKKRTGRNARSTHFVIHLGGEKRPGDRWEGRLEAYARHALAREFGTVQRRGGEYSAVVAKRYARSIRGRALRRTPAEHALGGDNRKRRSIVQALERG